MFPVILSVFMGLNLISAGPVDIKNISLHDALGEKCSFVKTIPQENEFAQDIYKRCIDWPAINKTSELSIATGQDVLCLLYYETLVKFCTDLQSEIAKLNRKESIDLLIPKPLEYDYKNVCNHFNKSGFSFHHPVLNSLKNVEKCNKLCSSFENRLVHECGLAYYFASRNISELLAGNSNKNSIKTATNNSKALKDKNEEPVPQGKQGKAEKKVSDPNQQPINEVTNVSNTSSNVTSSQNNKKNIGDAHADTVSNDKNLQADKEAASDPEKKTTEVGHPSSEDAAAKTKDIKSPQVKKPEQNEARISQAEVQTSNEKKQIAQPEDVKQPQIAKPDDPQQIPDPGLESEMKPVDDQLDTGNGLGTSLGLEDDGDGHDGFEDDYTDNHENLGKDVLIENEKGKKEKPITVEENAFSSKEEIDGQSPFFSYFMVICILFVLGYVAYHNRQKVFALVLEGKRGKRQTRGRRPNSANYHKLDSNLEEAISSTCTKSTSHVIY